MVETRRSSSSKRALSASPPPNPKRPKVSNASSSNNSVRSGTPAEPLGPIKESESQSPDLDLRSPDPQTADSLKAVNGSDAERSPDVVAEGETLGPPQPLGETAVRSGLKRTKKVPKRSTKSNQKLAWIPSGHPPSPALHAFLSSASSRSLGRTTTLPLITTTSTNTDHPWRRSKSVLHHLEPSS